MKRRALISIFFALLSIGGSAQSISSLQEEIAAAENEIRRTNRLLDDNKSKQTVSSSQLSLVRSTIKNRRKIITTMDKKMTLLRQDINGKNKKLDGLGSDLQNLKKEYAATLVAGYKNYKISNYVLFIFSVRDFNDLALRLYYLKLHSRQREAKAEKIAALSTDISGSLTELEKDKNDLTKVVKEKNNEVKQLAKEEGEYSTMLTALKSEEGNLSVAIKKQQKLIGQLNRKIEEIIAEEARKMKGEASSSEGAAVIAQLTGDFDQNKGLLPMPIRGGVIVEQFGMHPHPSQPNLKVNNKGVNIAGSAGSSVYAVFKGEVSKVFFFQGLNNCVMIRHGKYITVYSNLSKVDVKIGQSVATGGKIGSLASTKESSDGTLHFELWRETTVINPEEWFNSNK